MLEAMVSKIDVQNSTTAKKAVNLLMKLNAVGLAKILSAPDAPKIPAAEPLPLCNRINKISNAQTKKWIIRMSVYILNKVSCKINTIIIAFGVRKWAFFVKIFCG